MLPKEKRFASALAIGVLAVFCDLSRGDVIQFGSLNDGTGGFVHTAIDNTTTFVSTATDSVQYRNQNAGTVDAAFIKPFTIDRTADSGLVYTVSGTFSLADGYADDNNRLGLILFTDTTKVLSRDNTGQLGIVWNSDDSSAGGAPGNNAADNLTIRNGFNTISLSTSVLRDQTIPYAQDLYQGGRVTVSATFWFTGADINVEASMTDAGGVTSVGTTTVAAADYTGEYFGFMSAYRARNYDGTPDPSGTARDNPLIQHYESFSLTSIPEPSTFMLLGLALAVTLRFRSRH